MVEPMMNAARAIVVVGAGLVLLAGLAWKICEYYRWVIHRRRKNNEMP